MKLKNYLSFAAMALCVGLVTPVVASAQVNTYQYNYAENNEVDDQKKEDDLASQEIVDVTDYIPNQPSEEKVLLKEFQKMDEMTGRLEFFNSLDGEELYRYYINNDLTVSFKEDVTFSSLKEKALSEMQKQAFENKLKEYVSKLNSFNGESSLEVGNYTDGNGGLAIGSYTGDGTGTNSLSVSGLVKGDILLLEDDGEPQIQGAIMHAGIYDGSGVDICIYSAGPDGGVRWESVSDWRKNDMAWTMYVKGTTTTTRKAAYDTARAEAQWGEPYVWNSSKSNVDEWYCSKIPWYGYKNSSAKIDIDFDGGYWCMPIDIYNSGNTVLIKTFK